MKYIDCASFTPVWFNESGNDKTAGRFAFREIAFGIIIIFRLRANTAILARGRYEIYKKKRTPVAVKDYGSRPGDYTQCVP